MRTIAEIKENPKLEIKQTSVDGVAGILHMTGLRKCTFVASWGGGWEHVSVCPENRCPDWDEMCRIKDMFWNDDEVVMQLHPAKNNYVNIMPNCLHLWRPIGQEKVENVGFAVTISFNTEQKVTPEYLEKMAKEIEELPPVNFRYFKNVRPIRSENFA